MENDARALFEAGTRRSDPVVQALADKLRGGEGAARFALLMELLAEQARTAALTREGRAAERWAAAWARFTSLPEEVEALNLDRAEALWGVAADVRALARL
jgi:DNA polymerase-3 subunit delta'